MYYHIVATRVGGKTKTIPNKTEEQALTDFVMPYVSTGAIKAKWGSKTHTYQVVDMKVYKTDVPWDKKSGVRLENFVSGKRSIYGNLAKRAQKALTPTKYRCFVIMPIQGEKFGSQDQQRILAEFDSRFDTIVSLLGDFDTVAIRIDREYPMEDLVTRIKREIRRADFVICDLTDERPSCYYESGYAEACGRPVIHIASKESVLHPGKPTKIHFDIHMNVNFFTNSEELAEKLKAVITRNESRLFAQETISDVLSAE